MRFFEKLGALVEQCWKRKNFDSAGFAELALRALEKMPPSEHVVSSQIVQWVMSAKRLPPQSFGVQPPFTLYHHPLFKIGAFFWLHDEHTPIHQHCVSGAFHHLAGSSLHCLYEFDQKERINTRLLLGNLHLKSVECLMKGDSRPIENGRRTIHATFHLHRPTVTIVIQTHLDQETLPQYSYLKPSLAYDPSARNASATRRLDLLKVLHELGDPDYLKYANEQVSQPDFEEAFYVLKQSYQLLEHDDFIRLLDAARKQHGHRADLLLPVFQEMRRTDNTMDRSRLMTKPEHNLLIGLLLHLPDRESIFKFIRGHFDGDPVERIIKWVREMASIKVKDSAEPNALGIHLDELSLLVFRYLLQGLSFAAIKEQLKKEYDPEDVAAQEQELQELCTGFVNCSLFQPLFVTDASGSSIQVSGRKWTVGSDSKTNQRSAGRAGPALGLSARRSERISLLAAVNFGKKNRQRGNSHD